jgi:nucleotide-binding universal stress UspA family protein
MTEATELVEAESLDAVKSEIEYGSPTKEICTYIQENGIDLAIPGTQAKRISVAT